MSSPIITVENLGKCYRIHHEKQERYTALRDVIARKVRGIFHPGSSIQHPASSDEDFWALKDVSFEVNQGEVVGIIGRNGAGKSTLLKILSRITEPTKGRITLRGRVASLLEVGTGFHPELTGRENIFLNGAILGMTRAEIRSKFDEIVDFAEVEKFLDTPVKRYSSGMYVRLAFAVAAHLEPEILVVDEVLAVGDAEFQKKCLGKMGQVVKHGRTVLFVSHNTSSLLALCERGIVLREGKVVFNSAISSAVDFYINTSGSFQGTYVALTSTKPHWIARVEIPSLSTGGDHISGSALKIKVVIESRVDMKRGCLSVQVVNGLGIAVLHLRSHDHFVFFGERSRISVLECVVDQCWLNVGAYSLSLYLADPPGGEVYEKLTNICPFNVTVNHQQALFGWRLDNCTYLPPEHWALLQ